MREPSTLQRAVMLLADAVRPLLDVLDGDRALSLLQQLGAQGTNAQVDGFTNAVQPVVAASEALLDDITDLTDGLTAEDAGAIAAASVAALERTLNLIDAIDDLQNAVGGLSFPADLANNFSERLFNLLLADVLESQTASAEILQFLGVLIREGANAGSIDPANPPHTVTSFDFGPLGDWLSDPVEALRTQFGWGEGALDEVELLRRLEAILLRFGIPAFVDTALSNPTLDTGFVVLRGSSGLNPPGLTMEVLQSISSGTLDLSVDDVTIETEASGSVPFGVRATITPPFDIDVELPPATSVDAQLIFRIIADRTSAAEKFIIFGDADASRMEFGRFELETSARFDGTRLIPGGRIGISEGLLRISTADADGFLASILSGVEIESEFDLGVGASTATGVFFEGSSSLEVQLPIHLNLGPVDISAFTIGLGIEGQTFPLSAGVDISANIGPLVAVVQQVGAQVDFELRNNRDGNAGPLDIAISFKPPTGVGLSIDAGVVTGGGFLGIDVPKGEYTGLLQLSILDMVTVTAIGIINTRMPDGDEGFSLLAIISVEFNPGIQLGFGFTLLGVGGLVGLNRTMDLDALVSGARSGSIDTIMFPQDIIENATRIISDLQAFFPPEQDTFLIGPMTKFGWGTPTLISLSMGIIIEIPGNVAIVGKLTVAIPDERVPLIIINVAFIGAIEFDKNRGWFYAAIYDSRVVYITLEGGIGVLAAFGDDPNFVVSVGGFHPSYNPPELPFDDIPRLAINILNTPVAKVIVTAYFAVTSNTVQFGAACNLFFGVSIAKIEGHLSFDALFQFSPFYFTITISASLSVKLFGAGLFSVRFRGTLEGTSPWHIEGTGSISLLFWDVDVDFSETWGEAENTTLPPISVMPILAAEFEKIENWTAKLDDASSLLVSLRTINPESDLVLHPVGSLAITQRAVPLGIRLDKIGSQRPDDFNHFTIDAATTGIEKRAEIREQFATAQFQDLDDGEKLNASDFEPEDAGLELSISGAQSNTSFVAKRIARYEQIIIDNNFKRLVLNLGALIGGLFTHFLGANAVSRATVSARSADRKHLLDDKIVVQPNAYVVANFADNTPLDGAPVSFASRASANEYLARQTQANPAMADSAHIVRASEVRQAA